MDTRTPLLSETSCLGAGATCRHAFLDSRSSPNTHTVAPIPRPVSHVMIFNNLAFQDISLYTGPYPCMLNISYAWDELALRK